MAAEVGNTVSTISQAPSTGAGIFTGMASGMQTGADVGGMFGPMGAAIGAAAGFVAGGIFGGLAGSKNASMKRETEEIKVKLDSIKEAVQQGGLSLGGGIGQLETLRASAIQNLSGNKKATKSKKGSPSTLQQQVEEMNAALEQMLQQQQALLNEMLQSLQVLQEPTAFQPILNNLEQIVQKYQQFASAAVGNTQAVANANMWLTASLQQYATTLQNQVNQANEQAINDSLQLLDLEKQRYQLMQGEAKQEYDILTQGVLTRNTGPAAQKGYEIAQLRYQRDQQLLQMNEQISLMQYKVSGEQKIFDLAKDRIGLDRKSVV